MRARRSNNTLCVSSGGVPELDEVVEPARTVVPAEDEHGVLVDASHVAEPLVRGVAQRLHLENVTVTF